MSDLSRPDVGTGALWTVPTARRMGINLQVRGLRDLRLVDTIEHMFDSSLAETPAAAAGVRGAAVATIARIEGLVAGARGLGAPLAESLSWTGAERTSALRALDLLAGILATARAGLLVAEQHAETSLLPGDRDFTSARARVMRSGLGDARREVRQAETLVALPAMADAVAAGRVPLPHVDALARIAATGGDQATVTLSRPDVAARLVGLAQRLPVKEFSASAARLLAAADPAALEHSAEAQHRARFFVMSHQPEGTFLRGRLDRVAAQTLQMALASVRQAPDEDRDKPQADADALVALAERAVSGMAGARPRQVSPSGRVVADTEQDAGDAQVSGVANRPTVSVLVPAETFGELREAERRRSSGEAPAAPWRPVEPATLDNGTPLAMSRLARILCDCEIGRIVMSADSLPIDVGRTRRVFTAAQRRAVILRDRACAWNGCDVPAAFSEIHHIRWWDRDTGQTDLENGVLLCSHHHHVVHQQDLTITRQGRARPGETGRPMIAEPLQYVFERRTGGLVNAPPDGADEAA